MHSMYLARVVVSKPVQRIQREQVEEGFSTPTITSTYVDDITQWAIGKRHNIVRSLLVSGSEHLT